MPESQNIECRQSWNDDYLKWVCSFANSIGGQICIGIDGIRMKLILYPSDGGQVGGQDGGQVGGQVGGQDGGQVGGQAMRLTTRQAEVLALIEANPAITRKELADKLGINESAIQKHTDAMKKKGVLERTSETTGVWIIKRK